MVELEGVFKEFPEHCRKIGSLRIAASADEVQDCRKQFDAMKADNLPVEWYKGPEGEGLLVPTDGVMNPMDRARSMARKALNSGA